MQNNHVVLSEESTDDSEAYRYFCMARRWGLGRRLKWLYSRQYSIYLEGLKETIKI